MNICAFVFSHSIHTVAQNTQMTIIQFYLNANSVYVVIYTICTSPEGCFVHPLGEVTLLVHPIEVYPYNCLVLGLKCSGCSYMYQIVPLLLALFACMSSDQYFSLLFWGSPHWWHCRNIPVTSSGVGIPSPTVIGFGTNSNTPLIDLTHILKLCFAFSYMY